MDEQSGKSKRKKW